MGLIVLHSGHFSKIFKQLMGTNCNLTWREYGEKERLWICNPGHPICEGLDPYFELEMEEMYGEPFQVPSPDETLFTSWFEGGETFRSGLLYKRGNGNIFYFRPGHEAHPTYHDKNIQKVILNAVHFVKETSKNIWQDIHSPTPKSNRPDPIENIKMAHIDTRNEGIAIVPTDITPVILSSIELGLMADRHPKGIPIKADQPIAVTASIIVKGSCSVRITRTLRLEKRSLPRSPLITFPIKITN